MAGAGGDPEGGLIKYEESHSNLTDSQAGRQRASGSTNNLNILYAFTILSLRHQFRGSGISSRLERLQRERPRGIGRLPIGKRRATPLTLPHRRTDCSGTLPHGFTDRSGQRSEVLPSCRSRCRSTPPPPRQIRLRGVDSALVRRQRAIRFARALGIGGGGGSGGGGGGGSSSGIVGVATVVTRAAPQRVKPSIRARARARARGAVRRNAVPMPF